MSENDTFDGHPRRRVPRRPFERKVGLLIRGSYHIGWGIQVGEGGMMITSEVPLREGSLLVVGFHIPELAHVICRAVVRYVLPPEGDWKETRYGLQFQTIDFESKRHIRNYVASKTEETASPIHY